MCAFLAGFNQPSWEGGSGFQVPCFQEASQPRKSRASDAKGFVFSPPDLATLAAVAQLAKCPLGKSLETLGRPTTTFLSAVC